MSAAITVPVVIGTNTWRLTFKFGTIRIFEVELGKTMAEAFGDFGAGDEAAAEAAARKIPMDVWSALFWAALQPAHRVTREASDDLVDEAGLPQVIEWCLRGLAAYNTGDASVFEAGQAGNASRAKTAAKAGK